MFDFQTVPNKAGTQLCFKMLFTQLAYTIEEKPQFPHFFFSLNY